MYGAFCIYVVLQFASVRSQMCANVAIFQNDVKQNVKIAGSPIWQFQDLGLVQCMTKCLQFSLCKSVNFNTQSFVCHLMDNDNSSYITDNNSVFSASENWPKLNLAGACFNHECPDNSRCDVNDFNDVECVVLGCVGVPNVTAVNRTVFLSKNLWLIGDVIQSPCLYGSSAPANCFPNGTWSYFVCQEVSIKDCADAFANNLLTATKIVYVDVDGSGLLSKIEVNCDDAVTVIDHDGMNRTFVDGYDPAYSYRLDLNYSPSLDHILALIQNSDYCEQFVKYECHHAEIDGYTGWVTRNDAIVTYLAGDGTIPNACACHLTNSCTDTSFKCNCDINDANWREDAGVITSRDDLPMKAFVAGDTGGITEEAYVTIGPLRCWR
ncbi:contactin-associated protein like 5-3-like [Patella vulgata]|uniref:contactin-associated protein like 5-3-like n=1 Tax=Patella vulgata TaxID=6465 RepID=UPI0024A8FD79|nr:contactin-associated protein like 5-3-like [Patella vulgata]